MNIHTRVSFNAILPNSHLSRLRRPFWTSSAHCLASSKSENENVLLQFIFVSLRRKFAVLSNPVPDRQPCSALCRASSLGPLVQTEVMAGFPVKVSDWTVIYFYPERVSTPGNAKTCY